MVKKIEIHPNKTESLTIEGAELMKFFLLAQEGNKEAKEILAQVNVNLVLSVIKKFNNGNELSDEVFQAGCLGLSKAIDNFDFKLGVHFPTYAIPVIISEIRRYLRSIEEKVLQFNDRYINEYHEEPTIEIIEKELGIEKVDVLYVLNSMRKPSSNNATSYNDDIETDFIDMTSNKISITDGMEKLDKQLKEIIHKRYYEGRTQMEIAKELGISESQVSKLEKKALNLILNRE